MKGEEKLATVCTVRLVMIKNLRRNTRMRPLHHSHPNLSDAGAASTFLASAGPHPRFEPSDMHAGPALHSLAVENSVVNGGVSDTASQIGQINELYVYASI